MWGTRESGSSSEWVKAYELERRGWELFMYRATALTSGKDTSVLVLKHFLSCLYMEPPSMSHNTDFTTLTSFCLFFIT